MHFYDPTKDQSENFGWKKVTEEHVPSEEEQDKWSKIMILSSLLPTFAILGA